MRLNQVKTVYKPWGKEEWIELNDRYCYKRIYINAGHRTSYQYHDHKVETNYIIDGKARIWLENEDGVLEKKTLGKGEFFHVEALKKHRVIAVTDIILQEVSTPEVDDVIRVEDDSGRLNGRLEHEHKNPALCIVAAGKGSRLEHFSKHTHKGLLPVNNKAIISDIIDKTPKDYEIVIAVGYKANLIKEYCDAAHPDRNIIFVDVDNVDGEGSGPGYSLLCCKKHLQRPFQDISTDYIAHIPEAHRVTYVKHTFLHSWQFIIHVNQVVDFSWKTRMMGWPFIVAAAFLAAGILNLIITPPILLSLVPFLFAAAFLNFGLLTARTIITLSGAGGQCTVVYVDREDQQSIVAELRRKMKNLRN